MVLLGWQGRGDLDTVNQVEAIDTFRHVRGDLDRMAAAMSMLEVCDQVAQERHANPRLYDMLVGALRVLDAGGSPMVVPGFFLKVLALEGSEPVLDACASCGRDDPSELVAFDLVEGASSAARAGGGVRCRPPPCSWPGGCSAATWPACWPSPGRPPPTRSPPWPPRPWRCTSTGA